VKSTYLLVHKSEFYFLLPLLRKMSSIFLVHVFKVENGCGGTSTYIPFHLTSFILRAIDAQLTLCRTKRVVEVDQAESRRPFSLRSYTVLPSATTMLYENSLQNTPRLAAGMNVCFAQGVIRGSGASPLSA
jgi:hypothetical protein